MKSIWWTTRILAVLTVIVAFSTCATFEAFTPPIRDAYGNVIPGSINSIETVTLGGVAQTFTIRGADRTHGKLCQRYPAADRYAA